MSLYDWNRDGKKDVVDDFIEYQIYEDVTKNSGNSNHSSNGNMSTFGAVGCVVGGLVVSGLIFSGTDIDNVPGFFLLLTWFVTSTVIALIVSALKH